MFPPRFMIDANEESGSEPPQEDLVQARRTPAARAQPSVDRTPPHSIEAEQGLLGCLLLDPGPGLELCLTHLKDPRQLDLPKTERGKYGTMRLPGVMFFYELKHQVIFEAMLDLYAKRQGIDQITLRQCLADLKQLEAVGGVAYLSTLMDSVPSAANRASHSPGADGP